MPRLPSLCLIVGGLLLASNELDAQRLNAARVAVVRAASSAETDAIAIPSHAVDAARFRPIGALVGAAAGALYGIWVYAATSEGSSNLLTYSDHRLPKAVAAGAVLGLVVDVARYVYAPGTP